MNENEDSVRDNSITTSKILLIGTSEIDQLYKIASILGTPGRNDWQEGHALAGSMNFRFPPFKPTHLTAVLGPRSSARAVSLLYALLAWNPAWRSSAQEALRHSYFRMAPAGGGSKGSPTATQPGVRNSLSDNKLNQVSSLHLTFFELMMMSNDSFPRCWLLQLLLPTMNGFFR